MIEDDDLKHKVQGRLLMISTALMYVYFAGAHINNISTVGMTISWERKNAIFELLWFIWFYYYVRAYQYFKEHGASEFRSALHSMYLDEFGYQIMRADRRAYAMLPKDDVFKLSTLKFQVAVAHSRYGRPYVEDSIQARGLAWKILRKLRSGLLYWRARRRAPRSARSGMKINLSPKKAGSFGYYLYRLESLALKVTIYPPSATESSYGLGYDAYLGSRCFSALITVPLKAIFFRPAFAESYGPLLFGLIPVWQQIYLGNVQRFGMSLI